MEHFNTNLPKKEGLGLPRVHHVRSESAQVVHPCILALFCLPCYSLFYDKLWLNFSSGNVTQAQFQVNCRRGSELG